MSVLWIYNLFVRWQPWVAATSYTLLSLLIYGAAYAFSETSLIVDLIGRRKTIGIFLLLSFLPAYLIYMMTFLWRRTEQVLDALAPIAPQAAVEPVTDRLRNLSIPGCVVVIVAVLFGASQNGDVLLTLIWRGTFSAVDVAMFCGNCILWGAVGLILSWRIGVDREISKLGESVTLDIYRIDKLQPLAQLATIEILAIAGGLAFLPLQSLDAKLDLENYLPGISVGIPAAILVFLLPLWGAHKNILRTKAARITQLQQQLDTTPRDELPQLETITAHIDRVKGLPNWPIDVRLVTRIFFYVVIAPLAWVCAALVERLIDRL